MSRPLHDLLTRLMWNVMAQESRGLPSTRMTIGVTQPVFDGLVSEGMRATPPIKLPFWSGEVRSPLLRKTRVWQEDTDGADVVVVSMNGVRVTHTITAHQRMALAAFRAKQGVEP
ncbi:MAG: hypothetical protein ACLGIE_07845 [Alphaproteobacteria bacterium]